MNRLSALPTRGTHLHISFVEKAMPHLIFVETDFNVLISFNPAVINIAPQLSKLQSCGSADH